jgi:filamentous hemagglutinin family protein
MKSDWLKTTIQTGLYSSLFFLLISAELAFSNPEGGVVQSGNVNIEQASPTRLNVIQSSNKAIIDWRSFSIDTSEHTDFQMPSSNSVNLSRVTGDNPSNILGKLTANGRLMLVNPNGILFGKNSQVGLLKK